MSCSGKSAPEPAQSGICYNDEKHVSSGASCGWDHVIRIREEEKWNILNRLFPPVTNETRKFGEILYYAQNGITCYVIRGNSGDLLIDTGMPQIWHGLQSWLKQYDIRYVLLTHAHADHDWNAAKL